MQKFSIAKLTKQVPPSAGPALKDNLYKSEQAVQQYRKSYQAISLEEKQKHHCTKLEGLNFKVIEAKSERPSRRPVRRTVATFLTPLVTTLRPPQSVFAQGYLGCQPLIRIGQV
jgi:hypothetical protein